MAEACLRCVGLDFFSWLLTRWDEAYLEFAHVCARVSEYELYVDEEPGCGGHARGDQEPTW